MTPILFHGPSARDEGLRRTELVGRMISEPIGDDGLKVKHSRDIVERALSPGMGDKPPSLLVGPIDAATPEAADALLKTLEEVGKTSLRLILWADYLNEVIPTIRSRCLIEWCPPKKTWLSPLTYMQGDARELYGAWKKKDWYRVLKIVETAGKDWPDLMRAFSELLAKNPEPREIELWENLRECLLGKGSFLVAVDALLPQGESA